MSANRMITIETTALPSRASEIARETLGIYVSASQAGRYGTEIVSYTREQAESVVMALREAGHKARVINE